jgi:hypothetical protein
MIEERLQEFNQHRAEVLKAHLLRDKNYLIERRKRRVRGLLGTLQVMIATVGVLAVLKSLMLATNTPSEYARIIAPAIQGMDAGHPFVRALAPDNLTLSIAAALRPLLADKQAEDIAYGPPALPDRPVAVLSPDS